MTTEFQDTAEIKLSKKEFDALAVDGYASSPERAIIGSNGIRWAFRVYGFNCNGHAPVRLWVSKGTLKAVGSFTPGPANSGTFPFSNNVNGNFESYLLGEFCPSRLGPDGFVQIKITFTGFEKAAGPAPSTINDFVTDSGHYPTDVKIMVGDKTIEVHRHILCMISPVFQAAFTHDTKEAKTGTIEITDFDFETVKNVIDYCYGRTFAANTVPQYTDILMFADKYQIQTLVKKLEPLLLRDEILPDNFASIAKYAWGLEKTDLKTRCAKYYRDNVGTITLTPDFVNLDPSTQHDIIRSAAALK